MDPLDNIKTFETPLGTSWFDEDGILCTVLKPVPFTLENMQESFEFIKQISNNKKICILADATHTKPLYRHVREYAAAELPKLYKAIAIISSSPLGVMIANVFILLKGNSVPIRMFTDEEKAKKWLKKFIYEGNFMIF